jgi:hypothetical protein
MEITSSARFLFSSFENLSFGNLSFAAYPIVSPTVRRASIASSCST